MYLEKRALSNVDSNLSYFLRHGVIGRHLQLVVTKQRTLLKSYHLKESKLEMVRHI